MILGLVDVSSEAGDQCLCFLWVGFGWWVVFSG